MLILLVYQSSKLSLPTTSSSMMRGFVSLKNWTKTPSNEPILSRLPGGYKRTARMANQLPSRQRVINPKYAPCAVQCDWFYMPGSWISRMKCSLQYTRQKRQGNLPHWSQNCQAPPENCQKVRPDTTSDELKWYSAHSLRVWAWVLLDKAGKFQNFIKERLHS